MTQAAPATNSPIHTPGSSGFVCKATLRDLYLLTDKWIKALGPPDKTAPNPHYSSAAPMQLWAVPRVEEFVAAHEADPAFAAMRARRRKTLAARRTREAQREADLREWAESCRIIVRKLPRNLRSAIRHSWAQRDRSPVERFGVTQRDALNFVRHECSNYHELLDELTEKPPCAAAGEAYQRIKARTNAAALRALQAHPDFARLDGKV